MEESWRAKHGELAEDQEEESKLNEAAVHTPESEYFGTHI